MASSSDTHASYPISVRRLTRLLPASFRQSLTTPPLRFANPSPPSGWIRDSNPQAVKHARHTIKNPGCPGASGLSRLNVYFSSHSSKTKLRMTSAPRNRGCAALVGRRQKREDPNKSVNSSISRAMVVYPVPVVRFPVLV